MRGIPLLEEFATPLARNKRRMQLRPRSAQADRPPVASRHVMFGVLRPGHECQVLDPVIARVAVDVVDDFGRQEGPSEMALHHNAVHPARAAVDFDHDVGIAHSSPNRRAHCGQGS